MTREELEKLSYDEINRLVAENVMGWSPSPACTDWFPSTDYNDAATVRAEIERRGLVKQFVSVLWQCIDSQKVIGVSSEDYSSTCQWLKINATPIETCIAAILAVEGVK